MAAAIESDVRISGSGVRPARRLVAPLPGEEAWSDMWESLNFQRNEPLTSERAGLLEQKAIATLKRLEPEGYDMFCFKAHMYSEAHLAEAAVFSDLPDVADFTYKYNYGIKEHMDKLEQSYKLEDRIPWFAGAVGVAIGAIAGGAVIDNEYIRHATESMPALAHYGERLASAVGGIAGGLVGLMGSGLLAENYSKSIIARKEEIEQKARLEFRAAVRQYLQQHDTET